MSGHLANHTSPSGTSAEVDPELERQLDCAADDQPVEVVLLLRDSASRHQSSADIAALLDRVCAGQPEGAVETSFLPHLDMLIVRGCPRLIRRLIAQPEVELACANQPADERSVRLSAAHITET